MIISCTRIDGNYIDIRILNVVVTFLKVGKTIEKIGVAMPGAKIYDSHQFYISRELFNRAKRMAIKILKERGKHLCT